MRKILAFILTATALTACHESLDQRAAREAKEYTTKNCPMKIADNTVIDSMTFDVATHTVQYHYTLSGALDTTYTEEQEKKTKEMLLDGVRNAPALKNYKESGYKFRYTFHSTKDNGKVVLDYVFSEKDYTERN